MFSEFFVSVKWNLRFDNWSAKQYSYKECNEKNSKTIAIEPRSKQIAFEILSSFSKPTFITKQSVLTKQMIFFKKRNASFVCNFKFFLQNSLLLSFCVYKNFETKILNSFVSFNSRTTFVKATIDSSQIKLRTRNKQPSKPTSWATIKIYNLSESFKELLLNNWLGDID